MTQPTLCQPPEGLRERDGTAHYIQRGKQIAHWEWEPMLDDDCNVIGGYWFYPGDAAAIEPAAMTAKGWRYLSPIPTHAELTALVKAARKALNTFVLFTTEAGTDIVRPQDYPIVRELRTALSAFAEVNHD